MMSESNDQNNIQSTPAAKDSISAHRAFVYGACAPGWGEIYADFRIQGYATLSLFVIMAAWFTWTLVKIIRNVAVQLFDSLNGFTPFVLPELPLITVGISFFGIYFIWLWAMLSSVDAAIRQRRNIGDPPQASVGWAVLISWFCPGAGQIYTNDRRFGFIVFTAYLIGIVLMVPAYTQMFQAISDLTKSGQLPTHNPYAIIDLVHELIAEVNYSFGKLFQESVKNFAIAGTMAALRQGPLQADTRFLRLSMAFGIGLFGLGWLCPGSGQLLQGRSRIGWVFFAGYVGSQMLIGLLLGQDFITVKMADKLAWLSVLVQWSAMIEAPLAMRRTQIK